MTDAITVHSSATGSEMTRWVASLAWKISIVPMGALFSSQRYLFPSMEMLDAVKMFIDSDADAIDGINGEIRSGVIYNIAGQRLQRPVRGINIINGKKVLVK